MRKINSSYSENPADYDIFEVKAASKKFKLKAKEASASLRALEFASTVWDDLEPSLQNIDQDKIWTVFPSSKFPFAAQNILNSFTTSSNILSWESEEEMSLIRLGKTSNAIPVQFSEDIIGPDQYYESLDEIYLLEEESSQLGSIYTAFVESNDFWDHSSEIDSSVQELINEIATRLYIVQEKKVQLYLSASKTLRRFHSRLSCSSKTKSTGSNRRFAFRKIVQKIFKQDLSSDDDLLAIVKIHLNRFFHFTKRLIQCQKKKFIELLKNTTLMGRLKKSYFPFGLMLIDQRKTSWERLQPLWL